MRVVLDTNIVVSAFLSPGGKPAAILRLVLRGDIEICFSTAILAEYERVLCRSKFAGRIRQPAIVRFIEILYNTGVHIVAIPSHIDMPDETDRKFYDVAKTAGAALVTGNQRHYPDDRSVVSPADLLSQIG